MSINNNVEDGFVCIEGEVENVLRAAKYFDNRIKSSKPKKRRQKNNKNHKSNNRNINSSSSNFYYNNNNNRNQINFNENHLIHVIIHVYQVQIIN